MRWLALGLGFLVLALIWLSPLLGEWRASLVAGMVAHMGVIALAAPLIAAGLPDHFRPGPGMPIALPILASVAELFVVWGWHAPAMRSAAESSLAATIAEQVTFLVVGILLWVTCFARSDRSHAAAGAGALLLTSIHMTLLGALLSLSPRGLYGNGEVTCFGLVLNAGQDQQLGGTIMLAVGAVVYLAGGLKLISRLLTEKPRGYEMR